jgi:alanyl-tRNA synthetase
LNCGISCSFKDAQKDGTLIDLPAKHVDTGAGLERITTVLNNKRSNYDTDLFQPLIQAIAEMSGKPYMDDGAGIPHRVIADHLRCLSFAIADGAMPGNEGRGYVLRRILRRPARFGRKLDMHEPFIYKLVPILVDVMAETFPEVKERHLHISRVMQAEEEHFGRTLDRGLERFAEVVSAVRASKSTTVPGEEAFRLYDTFGFPLDLMQLMAREEGFVIDEAGFQKEMEKQKERARAAGEFKEEYKHSLSFDGSLQTRFVGYGTLEHATGKVFVGVSAQGADAYSYIACDVTPFYAEAGGQVSDVGTIELHTDNNRSKVFPIKAAERVGEAVLHIIAGESTDLFKGTIEKAVLRVDPAHRIPTQYNHTVTHLLQAVLREILGDHVHQQGSLVHPDYMRFDYTHYQKPTDEELEQIEKRVNERIRENYEVRARETTLDEAKSVEAMALFGEKYGEKVRLVEIGDFGKSLYISRELCGGTHTKRTGDIGVFVIKAETSVAAGVRRIEALTGAKALEYLLSRRDQMNELTEVMVSEGSDPLEKLRKFLDEKKKLEKELEQLRAQSAGDAMRDLAQKAVAVGKTKVVATEVNAQNMDQLKEMGDALRESLGSGIGVLAANLDGKPSLVVVVSPDLVKAGADAVPIAKELGKRLQGGGGGKPHLATAGGKNPEGIKAVVADAVEVIGKLMG